MFNKTTLRIIAEGNYTPDQEYIQAMAQALLNEVAIWPGKARISKIQGKQQKPIKQKVKQMTNIRTLLKNAKTVLFTDDEYFNKDITGVRNIEDIKDMIGIRGNIKRVGTFGEKVLYRLSTDYNFTLTFLN